MKLEELKLWLTMIATIAVPGSGYVFIGLPKRGLTMLSWMMAFAFITYQLTPPEMTFLGKISGGIMIWMVSVIDVEKKAKKYWRQRNI